MQVSTAPVALPPLFDRIPRLLTELGARWVLWRYEPKDEGFAKIPKQPNGKHASVINPATWVNFDTARRAYEAKPDYFSGVGIVLGPQIKHQGKEVYLIGIDFDHCVEGNSSHPS